MRKWAWLMASIVLLSACQQENEAPKAPPIAETPQQQDVKLSAKEKQLLAAKIDMRLAGRPLVRNNEEQSGVMYVELVNLNDSEQQELYFLTKTPTGYFEEVWGIVGGQVQQLYSEVLEGETTQRSLVTHNEHTFLGSTIAYEQDGMKQLTSTYQHVDGGKLQLDAGMHIELPFGSNEPTAASKNLVTDEPATLTQYEALVKSYKVTKTILKNEQGIVSSGVPFNEANATLDESYEKLTGNTYQVKRDIATISLEEQQELMTYLAALSLFHEDRTIASLSDQQLSEYAARDIVSGALRFFDVHFTDVAESVKTLEGYTYIGYNRAELDAVMKKLFGRSVAWQDVSFKESKLPQDLIVSDDYIYLPKLKKLPPATLPIIQHLIPLSAHEFYVELDFYELANNPLGYTEDTFLVPERVWSDDMRQAVKASEPKTGYAIVKKQQSIQIEKIVFGKTVKYEDIIKTR